MDNGQPSRVYVDNPIRPPDPRKRPFGQKAIVILMIAQAIMGIAVAALFLTAGSDVRTQFMASFEGPLPVVVYLFSLLIGAPLRLVAAIGLWHRRHWAWLLTMALLAYAMALDGITFFLGEPAYLLMALNVVTVFYLNQREVLDQFTNTELREAR